MASVSGRVALKKRAEDWAEASAEDWLGGLAERHGAGGGKLDTAVRVGAALLRNRDVIEDVIHAFRGTEGRGPKDQGSGSS